MDVSERDVVPIAEKFEEVRGTVNRYVVGHEDLIRLIAISSLSEGAILIEGVPGTAKTTVSKIMAHLLSASFRRVQGAVDVQPADIIGVRIYARDKEEFLLKKGPIFSNFVLIDEINRLTPKTQSALLEAMSEQQATIDGETYPLPRPFFVMATQNPYEFEGTFALVEAQRDRFLFSVPLTYLDAEDEIEILRRAQSGRLAWDDYVKTLVPIIRPEEIEEMVRTVAAIHVEEPICRYITDLVMATRNHPDVRLGASSRASLALLRGAKANAVLEGRTYVIPDDVKALALPAFRHRIVLDREALIGRVPVDTIVREILDLVEVS
ncbi:MoxR family ATPase [Methanofollis formosanus]|uniref:MoxR family ATPase n=1 Tax=Methanofollis formosanus TaxID=299308 RepID=A0A8G1A2L8_9EURY|nr:MoxR family ATPase [Methanofollis formosanus]QYZ79568.1 MoxR family ATPase [Methanofollis formosanus]